MEKSKKISFTEIERGLNAEEMRRVKGGTCCGFTCACDLEDPTPVGPGKPLQ